MTLCQQVRMKDSGGKMHTFHVTGIPESKEHQGVGLELERITGLDYITSCRLSSDLKTTLGGGRVFKPRAILGWPYLVTAPTKVVALPGHKIYWALVHPDHARDFVLAPKLFLTEDAARNVNPEFNRDPAYVVIPVQIKMCG